MELFKMNLYFIWCNNHRFKSRRTPEDRKELIDAAIKMTESEGQNMDGYTYEELEGVLWSL